MAPSSDVFRAARELFRPSRDPYAGADLGAARRLAGFVLAVGTVVGLAFLPLAPPTAAIGSLGWVIAGLLAVVAALRSIFLLRTDWGVTFNHLLALNYGWLAGVAGLEYLAGGPQTPVTGSSTCWPSCRRESCTGAGGRWASCSPRSCSPALRPYSGRRAGAWTRSFRTCSCGRASG